MYNWERLEKNSTAYLAFISWCPYTSNNDKISKTNYLFCFTEKLKLTCKKTSQTENLDEGKTLPAQLSLLDHPDVEVALHIILKPQLTSQLNKIKKMTFM